jgi:hypothetical protein
VEREAVAWDWESIVVLGCGGVPGKWDDSRIPFRLWESVDLISVVVVVVVLLRPLCMIAGYSDDAARGARGRCTYPAYFRVYSRACSYKRRKRRRKLILSLESA